MCVYLQEYIIHTYELHYMHSHSTAKSGKEIITVHVNIIFAIRKTDIQLPS